MKKEYVTVRLFKNHRTADGQITNEELQDSIQQQATEAMNNSQENNDTIDSSANQNESSLPQKLPGVIQRVFEVLGFGRKG